MIADALISAALWLLDKLAGAEPETEADRIRAARRATLRKAFPRLLPEDRKKKRF
ncbi:MAG TPA: hypothetical protein VGR91_07310 [Stellaceae bacterium]|nr:hypothetical protein [Stellaceae bacterium]